MVHDIVQLELFNQNCSTMQSYVVFTYCTTVDGCLGPTIDQPHTTLSKHLVLSQFDGFPQHFSNTDTPVIVVEPSEPSSCHPIPFPWLFLHFCLTPPIFFKNTSSLVGRLLKWGYPKSSKILIIASRIRSLRSQTLQFFMHKWHVLNVLPKCY